MKRTLRLSLLLVGAALAVAGCHTDMWTQPKLKPLQESSVFSDGFGSRPLVPGTVAQGHLKDDDAYFTGFANGRLVDAIPPRAFDELQKNVQLMKQYDNNVEVAMLKRGQEVYNIVCANCHGKVGDGQGMIALRGFSVRRPPGNFHTDRLRQIPTGHFYDVILNGFGVMYSMAPRVAPEDRWPVVAYIRALQLSQHATGNVLDPNDRTKIDEAVIRQREGATR